jgi:hypothetical protein
MIEPKGADSMNNAEAWGMASVVHGIPCSQGGQAMLHELHRKAAEHHELAAHAHRTAAEHNEKGDKTTADWHAERALEYSDKAYKLAKEAHTKSGQIVTL